MKTNYLFPHRFKTIGWILLVPATILGVMVVFFDFEFSFLDMKVLSLFPTKFNLSNMPPDRFIGVIGNNLTNELAGIMFITGAVFAGFSREKQEDEYIAKIRMESLLWATYINYGALMLSMFLFYEFVFLTVMQVFLFTLLIVFLIRYNCILIKTKRVQDEE